MSKTDEDDKTKTAGEDAPHSSVKGASGEDEVVDYAQAYRALVAEMNDLKDHAKKLETERAAAAAEAERTYREAVSERDRYKVALSTGVNAELLRGETEAELRKHAEELVAWRDAAAARGGYTAPHEATSIPSRKDRISISDLIRRAAN